MRPSRTNAPHPGRLTRWVALAGWALLAAGCGKSSPLAERPRPCVFDSECAEGQRCIDARCVIPGLADGGRRTGEKQFGEPCLDTFECQSGLCTGGPRGAFCTAECEGSPDCPSGFVCKVAPNPSALGELISLCALPQPLLCQPCEHDGDCGGSGGDHCIPSGIWGFCGQDCTYDPCPEGYACSDTPRGLQCTPVGETCDCKPQTVGRLRGCAQQNDAGTCYGNQACTPDAGWGTCSAPAALVEDCNGFDDDCDGQVDDDLPARTCTRQNALGTCTGAQSCQGTSGWRCEAPTPAAEACNYVDDDCDGVVDQPFVDAQGRYVGGSHCGGCGNACAALIAHSTQTRCGLDPAGAPTCFVDRCATGYFPSEDGRQCLKLADSLCRACAADSDCVGPGSRCLDVNGEKVCARDCSAASPYGACPAGYSCQSSAAGQQCVPTSGTCQCNPQQLGTTRSCTILTCTGYQACASTSSGPRWSACDVASFNPELCDGTDNDCDGAIDEGYRNPATGRYDTTAHCGFCNNDCSKYWSPTLQHTTGVCNSSGSTPVCAMGPCATEVVGTVTYEWRDVNGDTKDGCECRRVQGNTSVDLPNEKPPFVDENCDGVDGVISHALFVWAGANPGGNGSLSAPYRTLGAAVAALPGSGRQYILVAEGVYPENVLVGPGIRLYGGYSRDFKRRDPLLHVSLVRGQLPASPAAPQAAFHVLNVPAGAQSAAINGFTVHGLEHGANTPDNQAGAPSYAVLIENGSQQVRLVNNELTAGRGAPGGRGTTGAQGFGRQASIAVDGRNGLSSFRTSGPCPWNQTRVGGAAGVNTSCGSASAFQGGTSSCPVFSWSAVPVQGNRQPYPANSGRNGEGGFDWSFDFQSGAGCSHVTESGFPSNIQTHEGRDGQAGSDGNSGAGGVGASTFSRFGSVVNGRWIPSPFTATGGTGGGHAQGGGGGGAGGGTAYFPSGGCGMYELGPSGGGGGAGGCGGSGGRPGGAGGASIAVFVTFAVTPASNQLPVIDGNRILRNLGGNGGNGGFGGAGGQGGLGGFGGSAVDWHSAVGGKGGEGGNGGTGGGGGGGAGGPSFGILAWRASAATWSGQNTFLTPASAATGGKGGTGGSSSGPGGTGTPGVDGASGNVGLLLPCSAGCPTGAVCDPNGVCAGP